MTLAFNTTCDDVAAGVVLTNALTSTPATEEEEARRRAAAAAQHADDEVNFTMAATDGFLQSALTDYIIVIYTYRPYLRG